MVSSRKHQSLMWCVIKCLQPQHLGRLRQEDQEFEAILGYIVQGQPVVHSETLSQNKTKQTKKKSTIYIK
jgi:hypothetical protein